MSAQTALMRKFLVFLTGSLISISSFAQLELGIFGGLANYNGDLSDKPYQNSKAALGLTIGYPLSNRVTLRAGYTYAKLAGADSLTSQEDLRLRNLSFQTAISEFSLIGEFNTFDMESKSWSPYVFGGLAVFHFNPYTYDRNGAKVMLKPLSTEGQGVQGYDVKPYALTQLALPFGAGIKYRIGDNFRVALEVGLRKLFTDYLDDVSGNYADPNDLLAAKGWESVELSYRGDEAPGGNLMYPLKGITRGSPKYKDYYYFSGLHLTFRLPGGDDGGGGGRAFRGKKSRYGCPTVF
jgi:hypothetical protein